MMTLFMILLFLLPDDFTKKKKIAAIHRALRTEPVDVLTLRQLCISRGGLLQDDLRKEAWAKLLFVDVNKIPSKPGRFPGVSLIKHGMQKIDQKNYQDFNKYFVTSILYNNLFMVT